MRTPSFVRAAALATLTATLAACAPGVAEGTTRGAGPGVPPADGGGITMDAGPGVMRDAGPTVSGDAGAGPSDQGTTTPPPPPGDGGTTEPPAACNPACTVGSVCVDGTCETSISGVAALDAVLLGDPTPFNTDVLRAQQPDLSWQPSRIYHWEDFVQAVTSMHVTGVGDFTLWLGEPGDTDTQRMQMGLVNLAAFLAQSMKETIQYDACDENNWDSTNGYQISNACGQLGQNYENYDCEMACPRLPSGMMTAVTHASWYGAPGPLFCAPDAVLENAGLMQNGRTGRWNHSSDCWPYPATMPGFEVSSSDEAWDRTQCEVYAGQRGGGYEWDQSGGSVEGCCWWGRGVIQTTGRCNFGVLNHYLGDTHLDTSQHARPAAVLYPDIDFCADPEIICSSTEHPELKWIAGLFYWMSSVQDYDVGGWAYLDELRAFVNGGMTGNGFIDSVSGIVNRGCHNPPCATGAVDGLDDRRANFDRVLQAMGLR